MHPQSYQETQQYQAYYGYATNHFGQPVGNAQLNGKQTASSSFSNQGPCTPNQHPLSGQHGTYVSQAYYHGNGSYGMSSSNENSVYPPVVPASAQTLGSSHGYSIPQASAQNLQIVQPHQRAVAQSSYIQSSGSAQTSHGMNNTQNFLAPNVPTEMTQGWCLSNNSQTNTNVSEPNGRFQMPIGQPANNQIQTQLQQSSYQSLNNHNRSSYCQALPLNQAKQAVMPKARNQNPTSNLHYFSDTGSYGYKKFTQSHLNTTRGKKSLQTTKRNKNLAQLHPPNLVNREQQNFHTNGALNTEGYAAQPRQNGLIPSGINNQNWTQQASSQWSNYCMVNGQISRRNLTATSPTASSGFPLPSHLMSGSNFVYNNQANLSAEGSSNRKAGRAPNHTVRTAHGAPVYQQSSPVHSAQQRLQRAVAVVPPISKQTAESDKRKGCDDLISSPMKDVQSLANEKEAEEAVIDTDCATATKSLSGVTSAKADSRLEDDVITNTGICSNSKPLSNPASENKDISKDDSTGQLSDPHLFFGMPVVTFSLRMVRELMVGLNQKEGPQGKTSGTTKDPHDFARAILDLYWGGNYDTYIETELGGTFANVLKEAAEFDTDKDVIVFDAMKVEVLNQLYQKGCILTNCSDGNIAVEVDKSSWRNQGDDSLDIDKELADTEFLRQVCGPLYCKKKSVEQHSDINTRSVSNDSVSKEDTQVPSSPPSMATSDTVLLIPSEKDCTTSQCDPMPHIKLTDLSSVTDMVENQQQDLNCSGQNGPSSPILIRSDSSKSDEGFPDPMLAMQITVLSADELKALSVEFYSESHSSVQNVDMASSPISISSEEDPELVSVHTCQADGETSQMTNQNKVSTSDGEEIPSINSINEALSLLQTEVTENQNNHMAQFAGIEPTSPPKYSRKRKDSQGQQYYDSPPLKKSGLEPNQDFDHSKGQSTNAAHAASLLNQTGSTESPEKSSGVGKKRRSVTFKLFGAGCTEVNGTTDYYTESDRNLPPLLNIIYSPNKKSAEDKTKTSREDSSVPAPIKSRRWSGLESKNKGKNVPEKTMGQCQKSSEEKLHLNSCKDKDDQQKPSLTKHQSKRKKRKRRYFY